MSTSPSIILVCPQMGENIGAVARTMKNFGLQDLRIVKPRDKWPNPKAELLSVGAVDIIKSAKIYEDVLTAIRDLNFVYSTTVRQRDMNKEYVMSQDLLSDYPKSQKVGILFGRESSGLTNTEIMLSNKIITI